MIFPNAGCDINSHSFTLTVNNKQQGVVLFFALIALVVMMLAAVALIRSVDTDTSVAGNLAFKQSATTSADSGVETAFILLDTPGSPVNWKDVNNVANATKGYFATSQERNLTGSLASPTAFTWDNSNSALATGAGIAPGTGKDSSGNTIRYVIERMCTKELPVDTSHCMTGMGAPSGSSKDSSGLYILPPPAQQVPSPVYRVTARVVGPKNTISYIQTYLY